MRISIFIISFLVYSITYGQVSRHADLSQEVGYSARQTALGNASLGTRANAFDVSLNPALITNIDYKQIGYTHNNHFGGIIQLDNISYISELDSSRYGYGLSLFRLQNTRAFDSRSILSTNGTISYNQLNISDNNDVGLKFTLGTRMDSLKLDVGLEFGLDLLTVVDFSKAFSFGFDFGVVKDLDSNSNVSLVVENVLGRYYFWNQNTTQLEDVFLGTDNYLRTNTFNVQLPYLRIGYNRFVINNNQYTLDVSATLGLGYGRSSNSLLSYSSFNLSPHIGLEAGFHSVFFVRMGINSFQQVNDRLYSKPSVGIGLNIKRLKADYAISNFFSNAIPLQQHVVSVNYSFNERNKKYNTISDNPRRF